tara:strand:- start:112457 stop:112567 length:111 start_codon:yes stop_codon:yes gene_type:complete
MVVKMVVPSCGSLEGWDGIMIFLLIKGSENAVEHNF